MSHKDRMLLVQPGARPEPPPSSSERITGCFPVAAVGNFAELVTDQRRLPVPAGVWTEDLPFQPGQPATVASIQTIIRIRSLECEQE